MTVTARHCIRLCGVRTIGRIAHLMRRRGRVVVHAHAEHDCTARLAREGDLRHQKQNDCQWKTTTTRTQKSDHQKSDANCGDETLKVPILMDNEVERPLAVIRCLLGW